MNTLGNELHVITVDEYSDEYAETFDWFTCYHDGDVGISEAIRLMVAVSVGARLIRRIISTLASESLPAAPAAKADDPWVLTYTGKQFFVTRATANDIDIRDIAHGLSNCCRYAGQCKTHYSVAEHSVRIAEKCWSNTMKLAALLHDSPEAYLVDIPSLIKGCLPGYKKMEAYLLNVICDKYGVEYHSLMSFDISHVKVFDRAIARDEVFSLFPKRQWIIEKFSTAPSIGFGHIKPWSAKKAEKKFLKMFKEVYEAFVAGDLGSFTMKHD